ncbi:glutamine amidotransferase, partial [Escherichia coli]|uniref:glutamine amidotransferase n=1 Tax=Escherichia coli TaxID=562 RepID=UPI003A5CE875
MNNTKKSLKVLFIGESWHIHMIHSKGYDSFTSSKYEEGATWLLQCLKNSQVDVTYMPAHTVQIAFPEDVWICPYISRHLLSLNPLQARCRRYSRGER